MLTKRVRDYVNKKCILYQIWNNYVIKENNYLAVESYYLALVSYLSRRGDLPFRCDELTSRHGDLNMKTEDIIIFIRAK
jgi:hypothetical protein